jgi:hypothetical protein
MSIEGRLAQVFKALSIGILLDLLATLAVGAILGMIFAISFLVQGIPDDEVGQRIREMSMSNFWLTFSIIVGSLISLVAGFVAAHYLRFNIYPWLGLMGAFLGLISFAGAGAEFGSRLAMELSLLTVCSVIFGGRLWLWVQQ